MNWTFERTIGIGALFLAALSGCQKAETAAQAKPLEVHYVEVAPEDVIIYTDFVGTVDGVENADIRARVAGGRCARLARGARRLCPHANQ